MYSEILANIRTKDEALQLEREVDILLERLYDARTGAFEETLERDVRAWVAQAVKTAFGKPDTNKDEYLKGLKKELEKLAELKLTLAFEPTGKTLDKIHNWVTNNVGGGVVLEITVNPTILAGAILAYKGKYGDYSLRRKFKVGFESIRERLFEILSK